MSQSRQLAAIMFTDIVGYTSLMGTDEEAAFSVLKKNRELQQPLIEKHHGKLLKEIGDGILASFDSASDAVFCAKEIQKETQDHDDLALRVGVHIGDVVFQNNDVFGDGVNIASRIQGLAPVGGILVSEAVQKNISNKKGITVEYSGENQLRGVQGPVKTYLVKVDSGKLDRPVIGADTKPGLQPVAERGTNFNYKILWVLLPLILLAVGYFYFQGNSPANIPASNTESEDSTTSKSLETSIAVLPFDNFSAEKDENQHLCDGIMEEIINHLAKIESLVVRSRSSVEQYREDRPPTVEIGSQLGVSHFLEGSVQVVGDEMKVVVQLIEATGDRHIWQESYIQPLDNIFQVYANIAQEVAGQLEIKLTPQEEQRLDMASTKNPEAYELYLKAQTDQRSWGFTRQKRLYINAIENLQKAEKLDPEFDEAISARADFYYAAQINYPDEINLDSVLLLTNRAIAIDSKSTKAYLTRAAYLTDIGESTRALLDLQRAYGLSPNEPDVVAQLGRAHFENDNYIFGLQLMTKAEKLMKGSSSLFWLYHELGFSYVELYDRQEALNQWDKMSVIKPDHSLPLISKGCIESSQATVELLKKIVSFEDSDKAMALVLLGRVYTFNKDFQQALQSFARLQSDTVGIVEWNLERYANEGLALWHTGQKQQGEQLIKKALEGYLKINPERTYFCDREIRLAGIHAFLGNKSEAYKWLNHSKWTNAAHFDVQQDVWFSNINQEQEFKDIVNRANLEKKKIRDEIAKLKSAGEWEL